MTTAERRSMQLEGQWDDANRDGYRDGFGGGPNTNPYRCRRSLYQAYERGYADGRADRDESEEVDE
jgi:hypothetical protein